MQHLLSNLKLLRDDMKKNHEVITAITFKYPDKQPNCTFDALFTDYEEKTKQYQLLKIKFFNLSKQNGNSYQKSHPTLEVWANSNSINCKPYDIINFFNIIPKPNPNHKLTKKELYDIIKRFYKFLNRNIPTNVNRNLTSRQDGERGSQIKSMDDEPKKIYCCGIKRNEHDKHRTNFNAAKANLLRHDVYEEYKDDNTISFLFSEEKDKNKTLEQIRHNFAIAERKKVKNKF
ncbi:DUF6037 family protein [Lactobacillus laiwuensis]|uniref:DUF6037 family protein n=1 Tax=Lactobacillus laiwuensis TaxID=2841034 RepID=UPI001CC5F88A|nr:DUF6037 family protein [Lactobacillus laiwuensis]